MSDFEDQNTEETSWYAAGTDGPGSKRSTGTEYRQEQGWSDANFIPADSATVPPRFYTPQTRPVKGPKEPQRRKGNGAAGIALLCAVCLLIGAACGAALSDHRLAGRVAALEEKLSDAEDSISTVASSVDELQTGVSALQEDVNAAGETATAAVAAAQENAQRGVTATQADSNARDIYALACKEVVGVTTEVTYANFFGQTSSSAVSGSGFIISEDGYIVTNYHVIEYAYLYNYEITVITYDGDRYPASIAGVEEDNDLAVLKIEATGLTPATFGDSSAVAVGDTVYAVGNPLGELDFTMTVGHVSALDRLITTEDSSVPINMFQIDASVNSGNSGGPVYDEYGSVIGVVTAKYSETGVEGIGFAIPAQDAKSITDELISKGYVTGKAYLGVQLDSRYTAIYSQYYGTPQGAYVYMVEQNSAAEKAGIQAGDIITAVGETTVTTGNELSAALKKYAAGDEVAVTVYRSGQSVTLQVQLDEAKPSVNRSSTY